MLKKSICIMIAVIMVASLLTVGVNAAKGIAGNYYFTDIKSYVRGQLINSYNVGGKTVIVAEDLLSYGFDVVWDGNARTLRITDNKGSAKSIASNSASGVVGAVAGNYYHTDIVTYFDGKKIESYNLNGLTVIPATILKNFGYNVQWDEAGRRVLITDSPSLTGFKIKDSQSYKGVATLVKEPVLFNGKRLISTNNTYIITGISNEYYVPFTAIANELGIRYSWNSNTSTLTLTVPKDEDIKPANTEIRNNSKNYGVIEHELLDVTLNIARDDKYYPNVKAILYGDVLYVEASALGDAFGFFCVNNIEFYTASVMYSVYSGMYIPY